METKQDKIRQAISSVGGILLNQGDPSRIKFTVSPDTDTDALNASFHTPIPYGYSLRKTGLGRFEIVKWA